MTSELGGHRLRGAMYKGQRLGERRVNGWGQEWKEPDSPIIYYFNNNWQEIGYTCIGQTFRHKEPRIWGAEALAQLNCVNLRNYRGVTPPCE